MDQVRIGPTHGEDPDAISYRAHDMRRVRPQRYEGRRERRSAGKGERRPRDEDGDDRIRRLDHLDLEGARRRWLPRVRRLKRQVRGVRNHRRGRTVFRMKGYANVNRDCTQGRTLSDGHTRSWLDMSSCTPYPIRS